MGGIAKNALICDKERSVMTSVDFVRESDGVAWREIECGGVAV